MFSENLKTLRKQNGFSQEELASKLHVVRQTISKWEKNLSVAEQLSRINEQLAIKNRHSRRIWKAIAIILAVFFLISVFIIMSLSVPDLNNSIHNNQPIVNEEIIQADE